MTDLFLTPRGDLAIEDVADNKQKLEISFITSKSNALVLNFFIEDTFAKQRTMDSLLINFNINMPEYNKEFRIISGDSAMEQAIKIRLLSSLGSIRGNTDLGSKLETVVHGFIDKDITQSNLEKCIREAISDIIINPIVKIEKVAGRYIDYSNTLKVTIIDNTRRYNIEL